MTDQHWQCARSLYCQGYIWSGRSLFLATGFPLYESILCNFLFLIALVSRP